MGERAEANYAHITSAFIRGYMESLFYSFSLSLEHKETEQAE